VVARQACGESIGYSPHFLRSSRLMPYIWQRHVINTLLDGADRELSTSRYAKLAECSLDTALRDIKLLLDAGVLAFGERGGRSTKYRLQSAPPA
jgi:Fic family protein